MTEFSQAQKDYMTELFNKLSLNLNEKVGEIKTELNKKINELSLEIQNKAVNYEQKIQALEEHNQVLQKEVIELQRKFRKNNIVIFGLSIDSNIKSDLIKGVTETLTKSLEVDVNSSDISDIYKLNTKNKQPLIVIEFVSYIKKQLILKHTWKLKGKNITINQDLCREDLIIRKKLQKHLNEAKSKGLQAHIRRNKIFIGKESYTLTDLETQRIHTEIEENKASSAPSTPNPRLRQKNLIRELGLDEGSEEEGNVKSTEPSKERKIDKNLAAKKINTRSTSKPQHISK